MNIHQFIKLCAHTAAARPMNTWISNSGAVTPFVPRFKAQQQFQTNSDISPTKSSPHSAYYKCVVLYDWLLNVSFYIVYNVSPYVTVLCCHLHRFAVPPVDALMALLYWDFFPCFRQAGITSAVSQKHNSLKSLSAGSTHCTLNINITIAVQTPSLKCEYVCVFAKYTIKVSFVSRES